MANDDIPENILFDFIHKNLGLTPIHKNRLIQGYGNEVYKIETIENIKIVVKVSKSDINNYQNEAWAINEAKKVGVLGADVLFVGNIEIDKENLPILIQTFVEGEPLINFLRSADKNNLKKVYTNLGKLISKLHSVEFSGFSKRLENKKWSHSSWGEMILSKIDLVKSEENLLKELGFIKDDFDYIIRALSIYQEMPSKSVFCHGDLGPHHIFIDTEFSITGLIDYGLFQGQSPLLDFVYIFINDGMEFVEWMKEGYENKEILDKNFEIKLNLAALIMLVESISNFNKIKQIDSLSKAVNQLKKVISNLKKIDETIYF